MRLDGYKCDECGVEKRQSNEWWLIYTPKNDKVEVTLMPWSDDVAGHDGYAHYCGHECVHAALSRFMSTGRLAR